MKKAVDEERSSQPTVSIIIPVYNAGKKLNRCVESVLKQTYKDFELILLDDGSTDNSGQICDRYADKDSRVRVIHKENTGVSDTRNQGIALARGEYIQFVDSDDWIIQEATGLLVRTAQKLKAGMVISDFYRVIGERVSQKGAIEEDGLMDRTAFAEKMLLRPADFYYGVLWNKLFRRSIIAEHRIEMDREISWCEDFIFNLEYIRHCESIYVLRVPIYYYVKTKGSLVSQGLSMRNAIQMKRFVFQHYNEFYREVLGIEEYEKRRFQVYRFLIDTANDGEMLPAAFPSNYRLGSERTSVSEGAQAGEGFFFDIYRERKLQEKLFDIVALRNELLTDDVKLLYYLSQSHGECTRKEMSDILNTTRTNLNQAIRRLQANNLIEAQRPPRKKRGEDEKSGPDPRRSIQKRYVMTAEADAILSEILFVLNDFEQMQYEEFSQEEIELYERLNEKRNQNIRRALS